MQRNIIVDGRDGSSGKVRERGLVSNWERIHVFHDEGLKGFGGVLRECRWTQVIVRLDLKHGSTTSLTGLPGASRFCRAVKIAQPVEDQIRRRIVSVGR